MTTTPPTPSLPLVWVDCEMSGLDDRVHKILEIAVVITDKDLNIIAQYGPLVIHHGEDVIANFTPWCVEHHGQSGLTQMVRDSKISSKEADKMLLSFVSAHVRHQEACLAGNSVHIDKRFIDREFPTFSDHLHYRVVDVSTLKELCQRWYLSVYNNAPRKQMTHRALTDIMESIEELQYYRKTILKAPSDVGPNLK